MHGKSSARGPRSASSATKFLLCNLPPIRIRSLPSAETACSPDFMPNPWTGKGNPYTREEVRARIAATLRKGEPVIAAGAGTGISAKFIEKGGADLIIIYNSGRFRMSGHGSTAG